MEKTDLPMTNRTVREAVEHAIESGVERAEIEMMLIEVARDVRHGVALVAEDVVKNED